MQIKIRGAKRVIIISFDSHGKRFASDYERNKFFRALYGWQQIVPAGNKRYRYHRPGLLDEIPHMRIGDSVFAIAAEHLARIERFFEQWKKQVECEMIEAMMDRKTFLSQSKKIPIEGD